MQNLEEFISEKLKISKIERKYKPKTKEELLDGLTIEMFNIVFVFDKRETLLPNSNLIQNTYIYLEVFSRYFLLEEYRKRYLSTEVIHIIKFYDNFFSKNNTDNSFIQFMNLLSTKTKLFKIINYLYCVIGKNEIPKINMTNAASKTSRQGDQDYRCHSCRETERNHDGLNERTRH